MSTKITFNKQNSANADYVINLIYNNHDTNVAINSFKRNSGLRQEYFFFSRESLPSLLKWQLFSGAK